MSFVVPVVLTGMTNTITPNLWFDGNALEAAEFYCAIFPNARITATTRYPEAAAEPGKVMTVEWELDGDHFVGINGGPQFAFTEAVSFSVACADQAEIDRYWEALAADGGEHGPCGWLRDRFGLSWQVVPAGMDRYFSSDDPARSARVFAAMQQMSKLDIAALEAAAAGEPAPTA